MVLFNPGVITASVKEYEINDSRLKGIIERIGVDPVLFSPYNYIDKETPPTLIFHGDSDKTVNPETVILFNSKMKIFNNFCRLFLYEGEEHAFFNFGKNDNGTFIDTVNKMDTFLVELGYISAPPKSIIK